MAARTIESLKVSNNDRGAVKAQSTEKGLWEQSAGNFGEPKANSGEHVPYRSFMLTTGTLHFISRH